MNEHKENSFDEMMKYRICEHFITLTGKKAVCSNFFLTDKIEISADYSAHIKISGENSGKVHTFLTKENAVNLICLIMGMDINEITNELLEDGVGEISNIIAGWLKAELNNINYCVDMGNPEYKTIEGKEFFRSENKFMSYLINIDDIEINIIIDFPVITDKIN